MEHLSRVDTKFNNETFNEESILTLDQHESLRAVEKTFINEVRDDGERQWYSFFDSGAKNPDTGEIINVYNNLHKETEQSGWRVVRCLPGEEAFEEVSVKGVVRNDLSSLVQGRTFVTFQLYVGDERSNEILNLMCKEGELPLLQPVNQKAMEPLAPFVADADALEQEQLAA